MEFVVPMFARLMFCGITLCITAMVIVLTVSIEFNKPKHESKAIPIISIIAMALIALNMIYLGYVNWAWIFS